MNDCSVSLIVEVAVSVHSDDKSYSTQQKASLSEHKLDFCKSDILYLASPEAIEVMLVSESLHHSLLALTLLM